MNRTLTNVALVVGIGLLVGAIAYVLSARQEPQYESVARLLYMKGAPPALQLLGPQFAEADVEEDIKLSTATLELNSFDVAEQTALRNPILKMNPGQVAAQVEASPLRETLVVELAARHANGFVAAVLAKAYVDTYLKLRREKEIKQARAVQKALRGRLKRLSSVDSAGPRGISLRDFIAAQDTLIRVGAAAPQVIESPRPSSVLIVPKKSRDALFGVLFGLAVGAGLVALRSGGRSRTDVEAARQHGAVARPEPQHPEPQHRVTPRR